MQKAQEFTLVPWRPDMEPMRGKEITGTTSAQGIQWEWGPRRGLGHLSKGTPTVPAFTGLSQLSECWNGTIFEA